MINRILNIRRMESSRKITQSTIGLTYCKEHFQSWVGRMRCRKRENYFKQCFDGWRCSEMKKDKASDIAKQLLRLVLRE